MINFDAAFLRLSLEILGYLLWSMVGSLRNCTWTMGAVTDQYAAGVISMETDPSKLALFDIGLFVGEAVDSELDYSSSFLAGSLLIFVFVSFEAAP